MAVPGAFGSPIEQPRPRGPQMVTFTDPGLMAGGFDGFNKLHGAAAEADASTAKADPVAGTDDTVDETPAKKEYHRFSWRRLISNNSDAMVAAMLVTGAACILVPLVYAIESRAQQRTSD